MATTEVVLLPEEDGSVGVVAVQGSGGEVLLRQAFEITSAAAGARPNTPSVASRQLIAEKFRALLQFQAETGFGDNGDLRRLFDLGSEPGRDEDGRDGRDSDDDGGSVPALPQDAGQAGGADATDAPDNLFDDGDDEDDEEGDDEADDDGEEEGEDADDVDQLAFDPPGPAPRPSKLDDELAELLENVGGKLKGKFGKKFKDPFDNFDDGDDDDDDDESRPGDDDDDDASEGVTLNGTAGDDVLTGGPGDDLLIGRGGADFLDGRGGSDTADYRPSPSGVTVNLLLGTATGGDAQGDTLSSIENLIGSNFVDALTGDNEDNVIEGADGADVLDGGDGDDTASYTRDLAGVTVNLALGTATDGGGNADVLTNFENVSGSNFSDQITGDGDDNELQGRDGDDTIIGGGGEDEIEGGGGNDSLTGGADDEEIEGNGGDDTIVGSAGNDQLEGGGGDDLLDYSFATQGLVIDFGDESATGTEIGTDEIEGFERLITGSGNDSIDAGSEDDTIDAGAGNDTLNGRAGDDVLTGGAGNDEFVFNDSEGSDRITDFTAGAGDGDLIDLRAVVALTDFATVQANATDDGTDTTIDFQNGENLILSGVLVADLAEDDFRFTDPILGTAAADVLNGTGGGDRIEGLAGNDQLNGGDGNDTLLGGDNDDTLNGEDGDDVLIGGGGADEFSGGEGEDAVSFSTAAAGIAIGFAATDINGINGEFANTPDAGGLGAGHDAAGDTFDDVGDIETFIGSNFADTVGGGAEGMRFDLGGGDDVLDNPDGLDADETVLGGDGNDLVFAGQGEDELFGGDGNDSLRGEQDDDDIRGEAGDDDLEGGDGDDELRGGGGADTLRGEQGDDELIGNSDDDLLLGGRGEDELEGSNGDDTLRGGDQNDELTGGQGTDELTGGQGADRFIWEELAEGAAIAANQTIAAAGVAVDLITDFGPGDRIALDDENFVPPLGGGNPLTIIGVDYDGTNSGVANGPALVFDGTHLIYDPDVNAAGYVAIADTNGVNINPPDILLT